MLLTIKERDGRYLSSLQERPVNLFRSGITFHPEARKPNGDVGLPIELPLWQDILRRTTPHPQKLGDFLIKWRVFSWNYFSFCWGKEAWAVHWASIPSMQLPHFPWTMENPLGVEHAVMAKRRQQRSGAQAACRPCGQQGGEQVHFCPMSPPQGCRQHSAQAGGAPGSLGR